MRPTRNQFFSCALWAATAALGCGHASTPTSTLMADSNRDGVVDDKDRATSAADWNAAGGALFLANLDDDDGDGKADATDTKVNGADDELDLARIQLSAWKGASDSAVGTISIADPTAAASVNLFRHDAGTWTLLTLPATLTRADLAAGLELGIEANTFTTSTDATAWSGLAAVHLAITDGSGGKSLAESDVKLRVAPFVMVNNLSSLGVVWDAPTGAADFDTGVQMLASQATATAQQADVTDQWAEDWWQIGHTWMPGPNGATQGMLVAQRSAQPDRNAGAFAADQLGKDVAFIWPRTNDLGQQDPSGYSLDSFGDHDVLPPYDSATSHYPLGRIIIGGNTAHHIDPAVRAFYEAQQAQTVFQVDTTFLLVGHIDEIFSYVPAATPRGWKLLVASPKLARTLLMQWSTQGNGSAVMFSGQSWYDQNGGALPAQVTIDALLADAEVMAASQQAQAGIDAALAATKAEVGLSDSDIVELPILFERVQDGGYKDVAHMVGTVNLRIVNGKLGIPNPHGPMIGGSDALQADLKMRLSTATNQLGPDGMGLPIVWVEDWADYHALDGEVHCGSNVMAKPMTNVAWWEAGR